MKFSPREADRAKTKPGAAADGADCLAHRFSHGKVDFRGEIEAATGLTEGCRMATARLREA